MKTEELAERFEKRASSTHRTMGKVVSHFFAGVY